MADIEILRMLRDDMHSSNPDRRAIATVRVLDELLDDLIARREADARKATRADLHDLLDECNLDVDVFDGERRIRLTHLPTGVIMTTCRPIEGTGMVMRPIDTSGMTGDGGKVSWPTA